MDNEIDDTNGICSYCSGEYPLDDLSRDNVGDLACSECVATCESCESVVPNDDIRSTSNGSLLCYECSFCCEWCGDYEHSDESHCVGNESWCEGCFENHSWYCESCDTTYSENVNNSYVADSNYCEDCYAQNCYYCEDCGDDYLNDYPCDCEDSNGRRRECGCRSSIHQYSCKPPINLRGDSKHGLYMGFELETQIQSGNIRESADMASVALEGHAILKTDASISRDGYDGFEIVTQPATLEFYRNNSAILWDTINRLRTEYKARSWDTNSCGLHIHISRKGFKSGAHMHRFIALVYHNAEMMMKFAGRKTSYARFNDVYTFDEYDRPIFSLKHKVGDPRNSASERYSAVNTQNRDTLELRFFRGTMNPAGVLSALDLAQAMVEYTRDLSVSDVRLGALKWEWFADYIRDNNGFYPDLYNRLDKLSSVDINKPIKISA